MEVLVLLMVHTGMVGMVVCGGDKERDVQSTAAVLNEIGVGGFCRSTDNEAALKSLVEALQLVQHEAITGETFQRQDQAKGIERAVCIMKEGSMPIGWHLNFFPSNAFMAFARSFTTLYDIA